MSMLSLLGIGTAYADAAIQAAPHAASTGQSAISMFALPVLFIVVFYFLLIRPQSKKQKEHRQLLSQVKVGDEIVTASGIVGKLMALGDEVMTLKTSEATELTMQKSAIATVLPKGSVSSMK